MGLFAFFTLSYIAVLILYRPAPESLKAQQIGYLANIAKIKVSLLLGVLICIVFLFTSNFSFDATDDKLQTMLGINNRFFSSGFWFVQLITHNFVHENIIHLAGNLFMLGMTSLYERRVGAKRFLMVFLVSSLFSGLSIFLYTDIVVSVGISGGVFGFAAAYFTDHANLSVKDWFMAIGMFISLAVIFTLSGESKLPKDMILNVDHIGHSMGAAGAILYCKLRPAK